MVPSEDKPLSRQALSRISKDDAVFQAITERWYGEDCRGLRVAMPTRQIAVNLRMRFNMWRDHQIRSFMLPSQERYHLANILKELECQLGCDSKGHYLLITRRLDLLPKDDTPNPVEMFLKERYGWMKAEPAAEPLMPAPIEQPLAAPEPAEDFDAVFRKYFGD
jgi:hypothetical protein